MFIINYVLLKGKRQWLRKWLPKPAGSSVTTAKTPAAALSTTCCFSNAVTSTSTSSRRRRRRPNHDITHWHRNKHSTAEGPIDPKFKEKRQVVGTYQGIKVWGPIDPPGQLGIWGQEVCIDFDICVADGACIEACPVNVYEWLETPGHPASDKKAFMIREKRLYILYGM